MVLVLFVGFLFGVPIDGYGYGYGYDQYAYRLLQKMDPFFIVLDDRLCARVCVLSIELRLSWSGIRTIRCLLAVSVSGRWAKAVSGLVLCVYILCTAPSHFTSLVPLLTLPAHIFMDYLDTVTEC